MNASKQTEGPHDDSSEGSATREQVDAALVHVLTKILGCSPAEIRADQRRYAAFQQDDSTYEEESWVDWSTLSIRTDDGEDEDDGEDDSEDADDEDADGDDDEDADDDADDDDDDDDEDGGAFIYGRRDFDIARSTFDRDDFGARARSDKSLRRFLAATGGSLTGAQLGEAVTSGRIDESEATDMLVRGRIRAKSESLLDTARALFMLEDGLRSPLRPASYSKVERAWKKHLQSVEPQALRVHLGSFFLTAESARCDGAYFEGSGDDDGDDGDQPADELSRVETVAQWSLGEGQGTIELCRIVTDSLATLPAFEGHVLLRKRTKPAPAYRPLVELSAGLPASPVPRGLPRLWTEKSLRSVKRLVETIATDGIEPVLAPMREEDLASRTRTVVSAIQALLERNAPEWAYALATVALPFATDGAKALFFYNQGVALNAMGEHAAGLTAFEAALDASSRSVDGAEVPPSFIHNNLAWCLYQLGDAARGEPHARTAMSEDPENMPAIGTAAHIAFALGRPEEALELFRRAMVGDHDPEPTSAMLAQSPALLALVLEGGVPVAIDDDLAAKVGEEGWVFVDAEDDDGGEDDSEDDDGEEEDADEDDSDDDDDGEDDDEDEDSDDDEDD